MWGQGLGFRLRVTQLDPDLDYLDLFVLFHVLHVYFGFGLSGLACSPSEGHQEGDACSPTYRIRTYARAHALGPPVPGPSRKRPAQAGRHAGNPSEASKAHARAPQHHCTTAPQPHNTTTQQLHSTVTRMCQQAPEQPASAAGRAAVGPAAARLGAANGAPAAPGSRSARWAGSGPGAAPGSESAAPGISWGERIAVQLA